MPKIIVEFGSQTLELHASAGEKLSAALWLSGVLPPKALCNGLGLCGRCRCRFQDKVPTPCPEERELLNAKELADHWRLACHHFVPERGTLHITVPHEQGSRPAPIDLPKTPTKMYLGIDLGTTSIQWQVVDATASVVAKGELPNPQGGAGADVISRLERAAKPSGLKQLSTLVRQALGALLCQLAAAGMDIERMCVAANSVMTEIFLELDISGLLASPWCLATSGGKVEQLLLPSCENSVSTVIPPLPAPFVGGDISAGVWALLQDTAISLPFLLLDMGTNGELALLTQYEVFLASVPLGPALEGIGPAWGQPAEPGVITSFNLGAAGLMPHFFADAARDVCTGISGTGYISLLAILLNIGLMTREGSFNTRPLMPMARKIAANSTKTRLTLPCGCYVTSRDIETLLKVKAALQVAVQRLLHFAEVSANSLHAVYLAGALGNYVRSGDLGTLGFLPPTLAAKIVPIGNTALTGACTLARNPGDLPELKQLCSKAQLLNLADDPAFLRDYLDAMHWGV